jgi:integrase
MPSGPAFIDRETFEDILGAIQTADGGKYRDKKEVFQLSYREVTAALKQACTPVGISNYRSHDWRHTYAVQARRDGYNDQVIAHQLGHKTTTPTASDYRRSQTVGLTVVTGKAPNGPVSRAAV